MDKLWDVQCSLSVKSLLALTSSQSSYLFEPKLSTYKYANHFPARINDKIRWGC